MLIRITRHDKLLNGPEWQKIQGQTLPSPGPKPFRAGSNTNMKATDGRGIIAEGLVHRSVRKPNEKDLSRLFPSHQDASRPVMGACHFAVDTNILLNLYRYSDATRNEFIGVLKAIKDRLWLPHRVAQEYFGNRLQVISQQERAYEEAVKTIQTLQADLSNARQHPFLSDKLMNKLTEVLAEVVQELESAKATHAKRTSSDEIQEAIGDLFNGRVGPPYPDGQLETIWKEGEDRYARKVPPGYMDDGKDEGTSSGTHNHRKYGDLVVWRQIIDRATEARKGIIFVNDDKKEDWWLIFAERCSVRDLS